MKLHTIAWICVLALVLGGCATSKHHYTPYAQDFEEGDIPDFKSFSKIELINNQPSNKDIYYSDSAFSMKWYGNLHKWTNTAIEVLERELTDSGMTVGSGANKSLKISVESISATMSAYINATLQLKVITGDGYQRTYKTKNSTPTVRQAADATLMEAVKELLNDKKILAYLTK